jgi:hypothetical protein
MYNVKYCHVTQWLQMEFGLVTRFTAYLHTKKYSAIVNSYTPKVTTVGIKSSQYAVFSPSNSVFMASHFHQLN